MYELFTIIEVCHQLWSLAGERQVEGMRTAICHGTGGVLSSGATLILSTEKG